MKKTQPEATVISTFLELDKAIHYETGHVYTGHSLKKLPDGWMLVLRVTTAKGNKKVAFMKARTAYDCIELVVEAMHSKTVTLKWTDDRF